MQNFRWQRLPEVADYNSHLPGQPPPLLPVAVRWPSKSRNSRIPKKRPLVYLSFLLQRLCHNQDVVGQSLQKAMPKCPALCHNVTGVGVPCATPVGKPRSKYSWAGWYEVKSFAYHNPHFTHAKSLFPLKCLQRSQFYGPILRSTKLAILPTC